MTRSGTFSRHLIRRRAANWSLGHASAAMTRPHPIPRYPCTRGYRAAGKGLAEEVVQGGGDQVRGFLGQEVTGGQGPAADVDGVLLPDAERLVAAADEALGSP